jgi:D-alanine-D-alanine ligase
VSYLELVQVPYTGCNPRGLMLARDKALSKQILHYHRIRVPRFAVVPAGRKLKRKPARLHYPLIVKSQIEEASFGIAEASIVYNDEKLAERVEFMHAKVGTALILEQYIDGRELYVGVLGNKRLQVLPVWELEIRRLRADAPKIATRRVKWNLKYQKRRGVKIGPARNLPQELERLLVKTTKRIYRLLQLSGYARIDFRLDAEQRPYFLEANPNADIAYGDEFADAAEAAGIAYEPLLDRLLTIGLRKR